ncbi:hypothetical protein [Aliiruegeria lutimaris]|uniref:GIY-YIG domain-containing protein n=1 Tax=Aliiruegeria lutimaris TaxID=571298 RepID=A0A1G8J8L6_9RHOB|nr:hypothetical protein [Aliiruegeria lutimaris]SDI27442.1 hypothetical protein SAMN04488026_1001253 [Aliiruegeria lutimaris]
MNWLQAIQWSNAHTIHQLTAERGARGVIPTEKGFYAFCKGAGLPSPDRCLYVGIAVGKRGLRGRLSSYLRAKVTESKAAVMKHRGKRLISFARIKGVTGTGSATANTIRNDRFIHVSWAPVPLDFSGGEAANAREYAFMLERALIDYYRPLYNTADWEADLELELDEDFLPED